MVVQRFFHLVFLVLFFVPFAEGQISKDQVKPIIADHHHVHHEGANHCGICSNYLFDPHEIANINNTEQHYHGIGTEDHKSVFHCAVCNSHLGYYNHKHNIYEVLNKYVDKKEGGVFYCAACQIPLFEEHTVGKHVTNKQPVNTYTYNELYTFFKVPINEDRIALEKRNNFFKARESTIHCSVCDGQLGGLNKSDSGGFGFRISFN